MNGFLLYLIIPIGYLIASPTAVNNSAATLTAHYGYLITSAFFLFPMTLAVTGSICRSSFFLNGPKSIQLMVALPLLGIILMAGYSMQSLLRKRINIPYHCTPTSVMQEAQQDTCGDFQERCHSLATFQAAWINGSAGLDWRPSGGLLIQTSTGWRQQRMDWLQRFGWAWRAFS